MVLARTFITSELAVSGLALPRSLYAFILERETNADETKTTDAESGKPWFMVERRTRANWSHGRNRCTAYEACNRQHRRPDINERCHGKATRQQVVQHFYECASQRPCDRPNQGHLHCAADVSVKLLHDCFPKNSVR